MPKTDTIKTLFSLCLCLFLFASCAGRSNVQLPVLEDYCKETEQEEKASLKVGIVSGPYSSMFTEIIEPMLALKGYRIELVTYDNYVDPNFALANGEIDLNAFQHYQYHNSFKFDNDLDLSAIAELPTAAMGVYSNKYSALEELETGDMIAIPGDSTNLSRALSVLSAAGIISVDPEIDTAKLTLKHITNNSKSLEFVPMEAQLLCGALNNYDVAVINGNFALSGGIRLSDALYNESHANHEYINVISVRTDDLGKPFVMDLLDVLRSDEFKKTIIDDNEKYSGFLYPCNFDTYVH